MSNEVLFEVDTKGATNDMKIKQVKYNTEAILDEVEEEISKPSQDRPAILKMKNKRYHQTFDEKKYKPGVISNELRKALGLSKNDLPEHIYRMRQLGYPPGWLKKCEVKNESLSIIGANSSCLSNSSNDLSVKYDCDKLYEYPGFNSKRNYDSRFDFHKERGFWPLQNNCLINNFKKELRDMGMLGKEKTDIKDIRLSTSFETDTEFNLPANNVRYPIATSTPQNNSKRIKVSHDGDLSDGEILDEDEEHDSRNISSDISVDGSLNNSVSQNSINGSAISENNIHFSNVLRKKVEEETGTVLIVSGTSKPSLESFSTGIGEHRLFENLPNVGGGYRRVKNILINQKG